MTLSQRGGFPREGTPPEWPGSRRGAAMSVIGASSRAALDVEEDEAEDEGDDDER